jgi:hypothetical protein
MTLSIEKVEEFLAKRNECFMKADLNSYLDLWSDNGTMELNAFVCEGKEKIGKTISFAWSMLSCLHMETRTFSINGKSILNEFAIVWKNNKTGDITLQSGMGVIEINEAGKMTYLRDYFDSSDGQRPSALKSEKVNVLLSKAN